VVSTFTEESDVVFMDDEESTLEVSPAPPDLCPLQAPMDTETATAKRMILNEFFIGLLFKVLIINKFCR